MGSGGYRHDDYFRHCTLTQDAEPAAGDEISADVEQFVNGTESREKHLSSVFPEGAS